MWRAGDNSIDDPAKATCSATRLGPQQTRRSQSCTTCHQFSHPSPLSRVALHCLVRIFCLYTALHVILNALLDAASFQAEPVVRIFHCFGTARNTLRMAEISDDDDIRALELRSTEQVPCVPEELHVRALICR